MYELGTAVACILLSIWLLFRLFRRPLPSRPLMHKRSRTLEPTKTMVLLGSGGHTAEMLQLMQDVLDRGQKTVDEDDVAMEPEKPSPRRPRASGSEEDPATTHKSSGKGSPRRKGSPQRTASSQRNVSKSPSRDRTSKRKPQKPHSTTPYWPRVYVVCDTDTLSADRARSMEVHRHMIEGDDVCSETVEKVTHNV